MLALAKDREIEIEYEKAIRRGEHMERPTAEWQNRLVESYLESAAAWAIESKRKTNDVPMNPWTRIAHILLSGKYYE